MKPKYFQVIGQIYNNYKWYYLESELLPFGEKELYDVDIQRMYEAVLTRNPWAKGFKPEELDLKTTIELLYKEGGKFIANNPRTILVKHDSSNYDVFPK